MAEVLQICPICDQETSKKDQLRQYYLSLDEAFTIIKCTQCRLRWLNPIPSAQEYDTLYARSYYKGSEATVSSGIFKNYSPEPYDYEFREDLERLRFYGPSTKVSSKKIP